MSCGIQVSIFFNTYSILAGTERYRGLIRTHFRQALGILLVFDLANKKSFENCQYWLNEILNHSNKDIKILLVGNKLDIIQKYTSIPKNSLVMQNGKKNESQDCSINNNNKFSENTNNNFSYESIDIENILQKNDIEEFIEKNNLNYIETSALNSFNVEKAFISILDDIDKDFKGEMRKTFSLIDNRFEFEEDKKNKCCSK